MSGIIEDIDRGFGEISKVVLVAYLDLQGSLLLLCCPRASFVT